MSESERRAAAGSRRWSVALGVGLLAAGLAASVLLFVLRPEPEAQRRTPKQPRVELATLGTVRAAVAPRGPRPAFVGTVSVMQLVGASSNMLTPFGFILAIGIVVDDAIVVGENVFEMKTAEEPVRSSIRGVVRVARPVLFAVSTTVLAFVPLLFIPGSTAQFLVPLAVSLGFGVLVGTVLLMLAVTAMAELRCRITRLRRRESVLNRAMR